MAATPTGFFLAGHSAGAYNAVMLALEQSFLRDYGVTMPIKGVAALSGPYDFYPFEYDEVRNAFGSAANPEGTQPVNLVTAGRAADVACRRARTTRSCGSRTPSIWRRSCATAGDWVTEKYYDGFGHMEPVFAIGAMWRWRAPVLDDMVAFFRSSAPSRAACRASR